MEWVAAHSKYWDPVEHAVKTTPPHRPLHGSVSRMEEVLDAAWDPIEAFLLGAASQAVGDLTVNPELENVTYRASPRVVRWRPFAEVRLASGDSLAFRTAAWTFGRAGIAVPVTGGETAFGSHEPAVYWLLVRTR